MWHSGLPALVYNKNWMNQDGSGGGGGVEGGVKIGINKVSTY